jgi:hypothetical protein
MLLVTCAIDWPKAVTELDFSSIMLSFLLFSRSGLGSDTSFFTGFLDFFSTAGGFLYVFLGVGSSFASS